MPEGGMRPPQTARHRALLALVRDEGFVSVAGIASRFGVSDMTVRRDLKALEGTGLVRRTHGGAVSVDGPVLPGANEPEPSFDSRRRVAIEPKRRIARAAADLASPGEVLGLDVGTTTLELARRLASLRRLRVFTNSLRAAMVLAEGGVSAYVPGGEVRPVEMSVTGSAALEQLRQYRMDRAFLGVSGLTADGIFDYSPEETEVKRLLIRQAAEVVVLADAAKLGRWSAVRVAELAEIDVLVTDRDPPADLGRALAEAGVRLVVAAEERPA